MNELFAARLKKLREESGLTQEELGEAVGLSSEYISLLEAGKRTPSIIALNRISKYFQKNVSYFLETRENPFAVLQADERLNSATKRILTRFQKICEEYLELERITGRHCQLAPLYSGSLSPQNMAEEERRRLGLGNEPVRDIFRLGDTNGCRYIRVSLPDEARIAQEVVLMADRCDITEELVRFASHLVQFDAALESREPVGRKLDFLLQELGREVNTIGSKANDSEIASCVVELKAELEKIREQVQNIE